MRPVYSAQRVARAIVGAALVGAGVLGRRRTLSRGAGRPPGQPWWPWNVRIRSTASVTTAVPAAKESRT